MGGERHRASHQRSPTPRSPTHTSTVSHHTPPFSPTPATLTPEQECQPMPLPPQPHRLALTPGNHSLTNGDQTVTKVDTRLTRVDKTDHRQPPPQPQTTAKRGTIATAPTTPSTSLSTPVVNPSAPSRTNLNKSEQIRTNPNTAERPDQIGTPPGHLRTPRKKTNPEHLAAHPQRPTRHLHKREGLNCGKGQVLGWQLAASVNRPQLQRSGVRARRWAWEWASQAGGRMGGQRAALGRGGGKLRGAVRYDGVQNLSQRPHTVGDDHDDRDHRDDVGG